MSASDPPRGKSETPRTQQNSRLWGPPTLKRWNRRTMVLTTAAVLFGRRSWVRAVQMRPPAASASAAGGVVIHRYFAR